MMGFDLDEMAEILAGPGCDPLTGMIRTEEAEQIRIESAALPVETRELIALRYGEGLRCREIAQATGLSEAAVKQRLSRAVRHLRRRICGKPERGGEVDYATR